MSEPITPDEYTCTVSLATDFGDTILTRSEARRVLARVERFHEVWLDFEGVSEIGQAFADEIFRVFVKQNPRLDLRVTNAAPQVNQMISRAKSALSHPPFAAAVVICPPAPCPPFLVACRRD